MFLPGVARALRECTDTAETREPPAPYGTAVPRTVTATDGPIVGACGMACVGSRLCSRLSAPDAARNPPRSGERGSFRHRRAVGMRLFPCDAKRARTPDHSMDHPIGTSRRAIDTLIPLGLAHRKRRVGREDGIRGFSAPRPHSPAPLATRPRSNSKFPIPNQIYQNVHKAKPKEPSGRAWSPAERSQSRSRLSRSGSRVALRFQRVTDAHACCEPAPKQGRRNNAGGEGLDRKPNSRWSRVRSSGSVSFGENAPEILCREGMCKSTHRARKQR